MKRIALIFAGMAISSMAVSTVSKIEKYVWSANTGWIDFRPGSAEGVAFNEGYLSGFAYSPNIGWLNLGDGTPVNGFAYSNTDGVDSGVNLAPNGDLSGLAWSATSGWINFGWAASNNSRRARINILTGEAFGYAYGANIGWIYLAGLTTDTIRCIDDDNDGLGDAWEMEQFGSLNKLAGGDADSDGSLNAEEYGALTDPNDPSDFVDDLTLSVFESPVPQFPDVWRIQMSGRHGRTYQLMKSMDMQVWTAQGNPALPTANGSLTLIGGIVGAEQRSFFKVEISKPLR